MADEEKVLWLIEQEKADRNVLEDKVATLTAIVSRLTDSANAVEQRRANLKEKIVEANNMIAQELGSEKIVRNENGQYERIPSAFQAHYDEIDDDDYDALPQPSTYQSPRNISGKDQSYDKVEQAYEKVKKEDAYDKTTKAYDKAPAGYEKIPSNLVDEVETGGMQDLSTVPELAPYWFAALTRKQAEKILANKPANFFVLRRSPLPNSYTISYVDENVSIRHAIITYFEDINGYRLEGEEDSFPTITSLLNAFGFSK